MDISSLIGALNAAWVDEFLIWSVAAVAGTIGLVALVNAVDMVLEAEAG